MRIFMLLILGLSCPGYSMRDGDTIGDQWMENTPDQPNFQHQGSFFPEQWGTSSIDPEVAQSQPNFQHQGSFFPEQWGTSSIDPEVAQSQPNFQRPGIDLLERQRDLLHESLRNAFVDDTLNLVKKQQKFLKYAGKTELAEIAFSILNGGFWGLSAYLGPEWENHIALSGSFSVVIAVSLKRFNSYLVAGADQVSRALKHRATLLGPSIAALVLDDSTLLASALENWRKQDDPLAVQPVPLPTNLPLSERNPLFEGAEDQIAQNLRKEFVEEVATLQTSQKHFLMLANATQVMEVLFLIVNGSLWGVLAYLDDEVEKDTIALVGGITILLSVASKRLSHYFFGESSQRIKALKNRLTSIGSSLESLVTDDAAILSANTESAG